MQFQFQRTPDDERVAKLASGIKCYSIASYFVAWAVGAILGMIIIISIQYWVVLAVSFLFSAAVAWRYFTSTHLGRSRAITECVTIDEIGVMVKTGDSYSRWSWGSVDRYEDQEQHFVTHRCGRAFVLPKRVCTEIGVEKVRTFIETKIAADPNHQSLPEYLEHFENESIEDTWQFEWSFADIVELRRAHIRKFERNKTNQQNLRRRRRWWIYTGVFVVAVGMWMTFGQSSPQTPRPIGQTIVLEELRFQSFWYAMLGLLLPVLTTVMWQGYTKSQMRRNKVSLPDGIARIRLTADSIYVGSPNAVACFHFRDIVQFYVSEKFVGYYVDGILVHVLPVRAFGGIDSSLDFLRQADSNRELCIAHYSPTSGTSNAETFESGNPYQAPVDGGNGNSHPDNR